MSDPGKILPELLGREKKFLHDLINQLAIVNGKIILLANRRPEVSQEVKGDLDTIKEALGKALALAKDRRQYVVDSTE